VGKCENEKFVAKGERQDKRLRQQEVGFDGKIGGRLAQEGVDVA
jgi:hypothetical protein